jgi:hypothetical protein
VADLTTGQKARINAANPAGDPVPNEGATVTSSNEAVATIAESGGWWLVAQSAGSGQVTFTAADGRFGVLPFTVETEPLTISLGEPVAK